MAELTTLARPYAKAAFQCARQANDMATWASGLSVAAAVTQVPKVAQRLDSPTLTAEQKAALLTDLLGDALTQTLKGFVTVLAQNKRLALLPKIHQLFEQLKAQEEKWADVQVTSAFTLNEHLKQALADKLQTVLSTDVSVRTQVDPTLLGGLVIRAGDTVIDGSVKGRLTRLARTLVA